MRNRVKAAVSGTALVNTSAAFLASIKIAGEEVKASVNMNLNLAIRIIEKIRLEPKIVHKISPVHTSPCAILEQITKAYVNALLRNAPFAKAKALKEFSNGNSV